MSYETNRPSQLEKKRVEHYDKLYSRQPQLMNRLIHLMRKADIIQKNKEELLEEPYPYSPNDPLSNQLSTSEPVTDIKLPNGTDKKKKLIRDLNKFSHERKQLNLVGSKIQKITDIRKDILWGLK